MPNTDCRRRCTMIIRLLILWCYFHQKFYMLWYWLGFRNSWKPYFSSLCSQQMTRPMMNSSRSVVGAGTVEKSGLSDSKSILWFRMWIRFMAHSSWPGRDTCLLLLVVCVNNRNRDIFAFLFMFRVVAAGGILPAATEKDAVGTT